MVFYALKTNFKALANEKFRILMIFRVPPIFTDFFEIFGNWIQKFYKMHFGTSQMTPNRVSSPNLPF